MPGRLAILVVTVITALLAAAVTTSTSARTASATVRISAAWMVKAAEPTTVHGTVSFGHGHTARLQYRASSGSWTTLESAAVTEATGHRGALAVSFVPRAGTHTYRVLVEKDGLRLLSNEVSIRTTTGSVYLAKAGHYMAKYCPRTPLSATLDPTGPLAGRAHNSWSEKEEYTEQGGIRTTYSWKQRIELRPGLRDDVLRAIALHECAHIVQYRQFVRGTQYYLDRLAAADDLHGGNGKERQADCMAAAVLGTMEYATYTRECTAAQDKTARALWASYGSRYQDAEYTFTRDR